MAALDFRKDFHTRYYIRLDSDIIGSDTDLDPALSPLLSQSRSDTAVIYRFDRVSREFKGVAARSAVKPLVRNARLTVPPAVSGWLSGLAEPEQGVASKEERFRQFPERLQYGVDALLAIPLRDGEKLLGLLTLGRRGEGGFEPEVVELAQKTARLITAVIERDELERRLRERKVVERAKGILQQRGGLSEERAYLLLRSTSRHRSLPMFDVAREIVALASQVRAAP